MRDEFRISFFPKWKQNVKWFCAVTMGPMFLLMFILMITGAIIGPACKPLAISLILAGMFDLIYFLVAILYSSNYRSDIVVTGREFHPSVHGIDLINPFRKEIVIDIRSIKRVYHVEKIGFTFCFNDGKNHFEGLPDRKDRDWNKTGDDMKEFIQKFNREADFIRVDFNDISAFHRSLIDFYWSRTSHRSDASI